MVTAQNYSLEVVIIPAQQIVDETIYLTLKNNLDWLSRMLSVLTSQNYLGTSAKKSELHTRRN
jgi:hypothetical protein